MIATNIGHTRTSLHHREPGCGARLRGGTPGSKQRGRGGWRLLRRRRRSRGLVGRVSWRLRWGGFRLAARLTLATRLTGRLLGGRSGRLARGLRIVLGELDRTHLRRACLAIGGQFFAGIFQTGGRARSGLGTRLGRSLIAELDDADVFLGLRVPVITHFIFG
jgi:hypothetical protein